MTIRGAADLDERRSDPLGTLFGPGSDTATEVALLMLTGTGTGATSGLP
ncbi:hypothetical protein [Streptomyces sp. NPDC057939]